MAGGTGGHIFPGLAIASRLKQENIAVDWLGTEKGLEATLVSKHNIPIYFIKVSGLRGKGLKKFIVSPILIIRAIVEAYSVMKKIRPDVVVGMGGFASGPGAIAAKMLKIPLIIHEQNSIPGLTNRILSLIANHVFTAFPHTFPAARKEITVGNPVRSEITTLLPPSLRLSLPQRPLRLLVLGGSLGARVLNEIVPRALQHFVGHDQFDVCHQTGSALFAGTQKIYEELNVKAKIIPFIDNMAEAFSKADLVVCRAGALTISELATVGIASILVPFPHAVDDHQTANARFLADQKAAILLPQTDLTEQKLVALLTDLQQHSEKLLDMAENAYQLRQVNAAEKIVDAIKSI